MTSAPYPPLSSDGCTVAWSTWDGGWRESLTLRWQNEAWTAEGLVGREEVHYVLRLSPSFQVRQMLLFRDLDEPDLWLATDGTGRWGEVNGAHRVDLDGCMELRLDCTPFTHSLLVRRLPLEIGHRALITVARVDVETLGIVAYPVRYTRLDHRRWSWRPEPHGIAVAGPEIDFEVDQHGIVLDEQGCYRRVPNDASQAANSAP